MDQLHGLGWVPDIPSHLDYTEDHPKVAPLLGRTKLARRVGVSVERRHAAAADAALPAKVDLRPSFSPIEDQGSIGSCTAQAAAGLMEYSKNTRAARISTPRASSFTRWNAICSAGRGIPEPSCAPRWKRW